MPKSATDIRHFIIAGVLIAIGTAIMYWMLDVVLQPPAAASSQALVIDGLVQKHLLLIAFLFWRTSTASGLRFALVESGVVLLLFACVILHELAHAAVARSNQIPISAITLYPFGGVASLARPIQDSRVPYNPQQF